MSMPQVHVVDHLDQLPTIAEQLLQLCGDCRIVAFIGPMGAGKTTFIRSICAIMGVKENVSSPTFSIANEYRSESMGRIFHFDFYRLNRPEEAFQIGVDEYFTSGDWCFIEWPEKILNLLPEQRVEVRIESNGTTRMITLNNG